jgi:hypothetical protein
MPTELGITYAIVTELNIQGHQKKIHLDIFGLAAYNIVLGLPWL